MRHPYAVYRGIRTEVPGIGTVAVLVSVDGEELRPWRSQYAANLSPGGFEWGYRGAGPSQLALSLLMDATGDTRVSLVAYRSFVACHVSQWGERWSITAGEIQSWLSRWKLANRRPVVPALLGTTRAGGEGGGS